jgi:ferredoxin
MKLVGDCAADPPLGATARALAVERADELIYGLGLFALAHDGKRASELALMARHEDAEASLRAAVARAGAQVEVLRVPDAWPAAAPGDPVDAYVEAAALVHAAELARRSPDRVYLTVAGAVQAPTVLACEPDLPTEALVAQAGGALVDDWVPVAGGAPAGSLVDRGAPAKTLGSLVLILPAGHEVVRRLRTPVADWLLRAASACEGCRICSDACPDGVAAHEVLWTLATGRDDGVELARAAACRGCGLCDVVCPSGMSPRRLVGEVRDRLGGVASLPRALRPGLDLELLTLRLGLAGWAPPPPQIRRN